MTQLDEENCTQCNQDTPRRSLDCNPVSSAASSGRRAGPRARPGARTGSRSRSRERGVIDRSSRGNTYSRSAIFDREIITDDRVAQFGGRYVGSEVEERYAGIGCRSGRGGEA